MFEDHQLIRRAAVQAWTNLCISPLQVKRCECKNDKVSIQKMLLSHSITVNEAKTATLLSYILRLIVGIMTFQVKYAVLLCGDDEDTEVVKAASGALAMLTAQSKICCEKVFDVSITRILV